MSPFVPFRREIWKQLFLFLTCSYQVAYSKINTNPSRQLAIDRYVRVKYANVAFKQKYVAYKTCPAYSVGGVWGIASYFCIWQNCICCVVLFCDITKLLNVATKCRPVNLWINRRPRPNGPVRLYNESRVAAFSPPQEDGDFVHWTTARIVHSAAGPRPDDRGTV